MNKLQAMEVFVQVVDAGGFTRAAEQMQLPKATVSTLVQNLETALTVKLLHRTTRHVSVTADGAAYYERCLRILSEVREAEESLSRNRASPSGRLRVDVSTGLANDIIIPALPDSTLIARRIGVLQLLTCAAPLYLDRYGRPEHPNDLARHRCVNYFSSKTGKMFDWDFTRGDERILIPVPGSLAVNDTTAYLSAGINGIGIIQMASYSVDPLVTAQRVELLLPDWVSTPIPLNVVYPQNRHLSAKVRVFVEWIADLFMTHPRLQLRAPPIQRPQLAKA